MNPTSEAFAQKHLFLAVIWEKARPFDDILLAEIGKEFNILAETEVLWKQCDFTKKLAAFYGFEDIQFWKNKARRTGCGLFKVIIIEDPTPEYRAEKTQFGREVFMNVRVDTMKRMCRKLIGRGSIFHISVNKKDTEANAQVLFGKTLPDWLAERKAWHLPTTAELEALFAEGTLEYIGNGSRRECWRIPSTSLCVKCYREDDNTPNEAVHKEVIRFRHHPTRNNSCREFILYHALCNLLPPTIVQAFPDVMERYHLKSKGWCVVENLITNADGTYAQKFQKDFSKADSDTRDTLLQSLRVLGAALVKYTVPFYDPQNIVVQWTGDPANPYRLRIFDFEDTTRTLISFSFIPAYIRLKVLRRFKRYTQKILGIPFGDLPATHI